MKKKLFLISLFFLIACFTANCVEANTNFLVSRKSLKIYENYDINQILTTDSNNLEFSSSNEDIATISKDGKIFTKKQGGFTITVSDENSSDTCDFSSGYYMGIDVSSNNGRVDWNKVKSQGIDFAMIRATGGWYDPVADAGQDYDFQFDSRFIENLEGLVSEELPFGIYHVAFATTVKEAELEAEYILTALTEYGSEYKDKMSLPIAYDVEVDEISGLSQKQLTDVVIAFCSKIYEAGYTPIVYANGNFFKNHLNLEKLNALSYGFWYASYKSNPNFDEKITISDSNVEPIMWQYTNSGSVEGANNSSGQVDLNVLYMNDRVKVDIMDENVLIDTLGADKGGNIDSLPIYTKDGYTFDAIVDEKGIAIDENYILNNDVTATAKYTRIPITQLILNTDKLNLIIGKEAEIKVQRIIPNEAIILDGELEYKSLDINIAKVSKNGKITAVNEGTCTVEVSLKSNPKIKAKCQVVVSQFLKGDVDFNGIINGADASMVLDKYNKNSTTEEDLLICDMDNNGIINGADASMILDIYNKVL